MFGSVRVCVLSSILGGWVGRCVAREWECEKLGVGGFDRGVKVGVRGCGMRVVVFGCRFRECGLE